MRVDLDEALRDADRDGVDPASIIDGHKYTKAVERFPEEFEDWIFFLENISLLIDSGCPLEKNDLQYLDWIGIGLIKLLKAEQWQSEPKKPKS